MKNDKFDKIEWNEIQTATFQRVCDITNGDCFNYRSCRKALLSPLTNYAKQFFGLDLKHERKRRYERQKHNSDGIQDWKPFVCKMLGSDGYRASI